MYRAPTAELAQKLIVRNEVVAVVVPLGDDFALACRDFAQFALSKGLRHDSEEYYNHGLDCDREGSISLEVTARINGADPNAMDQGERELVSYFSRIGFSREYPDSARKIVMQTVANRKALAAMFPSQALDIDTQVNTGATAARPHLHTDIAVGMTLVGGTTLLILPDRAKDLHFKRLDKFEFDELVAAETPEEVGDGIVSVAPNMLLFFKGIRTPSLPFGHPDNIGATHCSPINTESPRFFIGSFVVPPGWGRMEVQESGQK